MALTHARLTRPDVLLLSCLIFEVVGLDEACSKGVFKPPRPSRPSKPQDYNGLPMPDVCFDEPGFHNVFVIGDWGGILFGDGYPPIPADKRSKAFPPKFRRPMVWGVDDRAQVKVATQMRLRARWAPPDYILNVGDNFYWGGVLGRCGEPKGHKQWEHVFETVYTGRGIDGKPWLGVLGNHDYGGFQFQAAWEDTVFHTWGGSPSDRWFTPALYYSQTVRYDGFSVDYFFVDSNVFDVWEPNSMPAHNLCGLQHNLANATCPQGPHSIDACQTWFETLWRDQMLWLEKRLEDSKATWQIIVTHFPPYWGGGREWRCLTARYGIDVFVTGHVHYQYLWAPMDGNNFVKGTSILVSGGGGGITSERGPDLYGFDDQYGFMHMTLHKDGIKIEALTHAGIVRKIAWQRPRGGTWSGPKCASGKLQAQKPPTAPTAAIAAKARRLFADATQGHECRGPAGRRDVLDFERHSAESLEECRQLCFEGGKCTGVEYGPGSMCNIWISLIEGSALAPGVVCIPLTGRNDELPESASLMHV